MLQAKLCIQIQRLRAHRPRCTQARTVCKRYCCFEGRDALGVERQIAGFAAEDDPRQAIAFGNQGIAIIKFQAVHLCLPHQQTPCRIGGGIHAWARCRALARWPGVVPLLQIDESARIAKGAEIRALQARLTDLDALCGTIDLDCRQLQTRCAQGQGTRVGDAQIGERGLGFIH